MSRTQRSWPWSLGWLACAILCGCSGDKDDDVAVRRRPTDAGEVDAASSSPPANEWSAPQALVETGANSPLRAIVDASGDVVVTWLRDEDRLGDDGFPLRSLWWGRFAPQTRQWQPGGRIDGSSSESVLDWQLVTLPNDDWLAIWSSSGGARARRYEHANGALGDERTSNDLERARCIAVARSGEDVVALFGAEQRVTASRYDNQIDAFDDAVDLIGVGAELCPGVQADDAGNVLAIWGSRGETTSSFALLVSARFDAATGTWSKPEELSRNEYRRYDRPSLITTPSGDSIATWIESLNVLSTSSYDAATHHWSVARHGPRFEQVPIGAEPEPSTRIANCVFVDESRARATLVWTETSSGERDSLDLKTQSFDYATSAWSAPATRIAGHLLSPPVSYDAFAINVAPSLASNADGDAVLVWAVRAAPHSRSLLVERRRGLAGAWSALQRVDDTEPAPYRSGIASTPVALVTPGGSAIVLWSAATAEDGDADVGLPTLWVSRAER